MWKTVESLDASESHPRRLDAKEVLSPQMGVFFFFLKKKNPVADGTATVFGSDHEFRAPTLRRDHTVRSEDLSGELQGEPEGPQPTDWKSCSEEREARKDKEKVMR